LLQLTILADRVLQQTYSEDVDACAKISSSYGTTDDVIWHLGFKVGYGYQCTIFNNSGLDDMAMVESNYAWSGFGSCYPMKTLVEGGWKELSYLMYGKVIFNIDFFPDTEPIIFYLIQYYFGIMAKK
jgi:hypothetical protein